MRVHTYTVVNVVLAGLALAGCGDNGVVSAPRVPAAISLASPAFAAGGSIPRRFTCDGAGGSPPLRWSGVPRATRSLSLQVDDPDAPGGTFRHWTLTAISPATHALSASRPGWKPPCPPKGDTPHHYVFTLTARDASGSAIATGTLTGRYGR